MESNSPLPDHGPLREPEFPFEPYTGQEPYLFVSYAHADRDAVFADMRRLHRVGCRMWYDRAIRVGRTWPDEIAQALDRSAGLLLFLSQHAAASPHVCNEVYTALDAKKLVLIVQLGPVELTEGLRLRLASIQAILRGDVADHDLCQSLSRSVPPEVYRRSAPLPLPQSRRELGRIVGVDFGTRNSVMAMYDGADVITIANRDGQRSTPSVVAWSETGGWLIGAAALAQAEINAENTIFSVKSRLGTDWTVPCGGRPRGAVEFAAMILRQMREDAVSRLRNENIEAVVTVPAHFSFRQKSELLAAYSIAGWKVARVISEATAAALAADKGGTPAREHGTFAVFDLGAGTFDVSIVDTAETGDLLQVLASGGNDVGGDAFDEALARWCLARFEAETGVSVEPGTEPWLRVRHACEQAKIVLSHVPAARVVVPHLAFRDGRPLHLDVPVTLDEFIRLSAPLVETTLERSRAALAYSKRSLDRLDAVVLAGLGSRIPGIRAAVREFFHREPVVPTDPLECVATGAAIQGAIIDQRERDYLLVDTTAHEIAVETAAGPLETLVPADTTIPTEKIERLRAVEPRQNGVIVRVLEVPPEGTGAPQLIGVVVFPAGDVSADDELFDVAVSIDANSEFQVSVRSRTTGRTASDCFQYGTLIDTSRFAALRGNLVRVMPNEQPAPAPDHPAE